MAFLHRRFSEADSSAVSEVGYDGKTRRLYVTYRGKAETYVYLGVPRTAYDRLLTAASIGAFVNQHIKPHYKYQHLRAA